jgi:hypothetical protein
MQGKVARRPRSAKLMKNTPFNAPGISKGNGSDYSFHVTFLLK